MAEKRRDSIADDWLEVESAASVLSLPDDDDHELYHHSRPTSPLLPPQAHHSPGSSYTPQVQLAVEKPTPESPRQSPERSPTPHNEATEAKPSASIEETSLDDDTFSANPIDCHKSCCTAITSLDDVAKLARELAGTRVSTLSLLQSTCKGILTQAKDLETMLGAYAKHWVAQGSNVDADDMPLSASVWDWISNLRDELLRAQGEMLHLKSKPTEETTDSTDSILPTTLEAKDIPLSTNMALASCLEKLEDMQNTLADFLPIFKVDFDEFRTKWMNFPLKETDKELQPPQSPRSSRRQPPHPAVCRIRRALYDLKDHIQMIVVFLSKLCHSHPTPGIIDPTVTRSLVDLSEAITTILTNHGSEWIESDTRSTPQGLISYTQFLELDPDVLHDINGHLDNFKEELDIDKSERVASLYTPEMIHNHQVFLLLEGGQLNELRGVIELLWSILIKDTQTDGNWI
ncbi:Hypothetical protein NCS54_01206900 [Fusarium falciforme]|uniref:Hypothetical protein n=1 Tax=Fusarium falciforme TaxID=195108 RepID=UPI0022FFFEE8|nr:Hypothetical protein NCS54_01206900 [Fusarium falciforme]WAO94483.1 Hypothetical protein NCS54_01206900 [Fusarium falciforme]